jgi:hypothetical protein
VGVVEARLPDGGAVLVSRVHAPANIKRLLELERDLRAATEAVSNTESVVAWQDRITRKAIRQAAADARLELRALDWRLSRIADLPDDEKRTEIRSEDGQTVAEYALALGVSVIALPMLLWLMGALAVWMTRESRPVQDVPPTVIYAPDPNAHVQGVCVLPTIAEREACAADYLAQNP